MSLPKDIADKLNIKYGADLVFNMSPGIDMGGIYKAGATALHEIYLEVAPEFDVTETERRVRHREGDFDYDIDGHMEFYAFVRGARWQHLHLAPLIAARDARLSQLESELKDRGVERAKAEIRIKELDAECDSWQERARINGQKAFELQAKLERYEKALEKIKLTGFSDHVKLRQFAVDALDGRDDG